MKVSFSADWKIRSYLCDLVKLAEEFVQRVDKFPRRTVAGQPGESHDVCIQNAAQQRNNTHETLKYKGRLSETWWKCLYECMSSKCPLTGKRTRQRRKFDFHLGQNQSWCHSDLHTPAGRLRGSLLSPFIVSFFLQ